MMKIVLFNFKVFIVFSIIEFIIFSIRAFFQLYRFHTIGNQYQNGNIITEDNHLNFEAWHRLFSAQTIVTNLKNFGYFLLDIIEFIMKSVISVSFVIMSIFFIIWIFYAILRNRNYERNVFLNDIEAARLKSNIIKALELKRKSKTIGRKISKSNQSSDSDTYSMEVDKSALDIMLKMNVFVNTRQSLEDDSIVTSYRIEVEPPTGQDEYEKLMGYLKNIGDVADHQMKGKVSFGDLSLSKDRTLISCNAFLSEKDKYDYSDWVAEDSSDSNESYDYTYSLSHLKDNRSKIKELQHKAQVWADRTGDTLDNFLTTSNAKVNRLSTYVSASKALYTYAITFKIDVQNFEKFQDSLDTIFGTKGITAKIHNGNLQIAIPLRDDLIVPIDVGSMYREVFGDDGS